MLITIDQQIEWLRKEIVRHKKVLPLQIEAGRVSEEMATHVLTCAEATIQTLTQLRSLTRGKA